MMSVRAGMTAFVAVDNAVMEYRGMSCRRCPQASLVWR